MIKKYDHFSIKIVFLFYIYIFFKNFLLNCFFKKKINFKINKKKSLFFKKKSVKDSLISKRISIVLRKRKKFKKFKSKKIDKGNFFLKKFFFKTLLKNRRFLRKLFFFNDKKRQLKITKKIHSLSKNTLNSKNNILDYSLLNLLLRSGLFFFYKDIIEFISSGLVYINGVVIKNHNTILSSGDLIQLPISNYLYKYTLFSKKILKKKMSLFRFTTWKFFKKRYFKKKQSLKSKKRKNPKYLPIFSNYKLNTPRYIEVDFFTFTIFILKQHNYSVQPTYYLNKPFSFKLFPLYNFKKIN